MCGPIPMAISICVICFNEEKNIRRCLESSKWADEIIVVDSMSQDKTIEIASEYTDKLYQRIWSGFVDGLNIIPASIIWPAASAPDRIVL